CFPLHSASFRRASSLMSEEQTKTKEEWLRSEVRATISQIFVLLQWGVAVLAATELNLYYIRRDITKHLVKQNVIQPHELLPFFRWFVGTLLLTLLAGV